MQKFLLEDNDSQGEETEDDEEMEVEFEDEPRSLLEVTEKLLASDVELEINMRTSRAQSFDTGFNMEFSYEEDKHPLIHAYF